MYFNNNGHKFLTSICVVQSSSHVCAVYVYDYVCVCKNERVVCVYLMRVYIDVYVCAYACIFFYVLRLQVCVRELDATSF